MWTFHEHRLDLHWEIFSRSNWCTLNELNFHSKFPWSPKALLHGMRAPIQTKVMSKGNAGIEEQKGEQNCFSIVNERWKLHSGGGLNKKKQQKKKTDITWNVDSWCLHINVRIYILIKKNLHLNQRRLNCSASVFQ